jgi:hypothetical protein
LPLQIKRRFPAGNAGKLSALFSGCTMVPHYFALRRWKNFLGFEEQVPLRFMLRKNLSIDNITTPINFRWAVTFENFEGPIKN